MSVSIFRLIFLFSTISRKLSDMKFYVFDVQSGLELSICGPFLSKKYENGKKVHKNVVYLSDLNDDVPISKSA